MRLSKPIRFFALLALLLALVPLSVLAQSSNGSISGTVTDDTGGALPGVSVTATNLGSYDGNKVNDGTLEIKAFDFNGASASHLVADFGSAKAMKEMWPQ